MTTYDPSIPLVWIDLETGGLDAHEDPTLEVGCVLTSVAGDLIEGTEYTATHLHSPDEVETARDAAIPYVRNMHDQNGLWDDLVNGKPLEEIEEDLLDLIGGHVSVPGTALIAGSSVRLDQNFLEVDLNGVYEYLHYRSVDVSGLRHVLVTNGLASPLPDTDDAPHRALPDLYRSIAEYKHLLGQLARKADLDAAVAARDEYREKWVRACNAQVNTQELAQQIMDDVNALRGLLAPILTAWASEEPSGREGRQSEVGDAHPLLAEALDAAIAAITPPEPPADPGDDVPDDASSLLNG